MSRTKTATTMTKKELERKTRSLIAMAHAQQWESLVSMLEAGVPPELADFILDGVGAKKVSYFVEDRELPRLELDLDDARWIQGMGSNSRKGRFSYAHEVLYTGFLNLFALAFIGQSTLRSPFRKLLPRIKELEVNFTYGNSIKISDSSSGGEPAIRLLNLALKFAVALERLSLAADSIDIQHLCLPEKLKTLNLEAGEVRLRDSDLAALDRRKTLLGIDERRLRLLSPELLRCILADGRDLNMESLERLKSEEAEVLAGNVGEVRLGRDMVVPEEALAKLRRHRSFRPADRNQIWLTTLNRDTPLTQLKLGDGNHLVFGAHVLDYATGRICLDLSDKVEEIVVGQGNAFIRRERSIECRCLQDGKTLWKRSFKKEANNKIVLAGDLLVFGDDGDLSKLSARDGSPIAKLALELTSGGMANGTDFIMEHYCFDKKLFLWSPKNKYQGGKWLAAIDIDRFAVEWTVELPAITGQGMVADPQGHLAFAVVDQLLRIDPATGTIVGKRARLSGSWPVACKCYPDGSVVAGCQKGYETPEMKCFDAAGADLWSIPLGCSEGDSEIRENARAAAFFDDVILMSFQDNDRSFIWIIDRRKGKILHKIEQKSFEIGLWRQVACFDDRHILLVGDRGCALYDGIPSSWI
jgi:hypothetical protein